MSSAFFRQGEDAYLLLALPYRLNLVTGVFTYPTVDTDVYYRILDGLGNLAPGGQGTLDQLSVNITGATQSIASSFVLIKLPSGMGGAVGNWGWELSSNSSTQFLKQNGMFQWGGTVDLMALGGQVAAQSANNMINDGASYRSTATPLIVFNAFVNPATGLHEDDSTTLATMTLINPFFVVTTPACSYIAAAGAWFASPAAYALGQWYAILTQVIDGVTYTQAGIFIWGESDLLTQVPAQNIQPMLNNGQPVRQTDTPMFAFLPFVDPATGLPDGSTPTMMVLPPSPAVGQTLTVMGTGPWFNSSSPTFTTAGRYFVMLQSTINGVLFSAYGYVDWGDTGCVAINTNTLADTAAQQATLARKVLANKTTPNSSVTPTSLTIYDDNGVTPLGTRTIANADASAVSPTQVLDLGKIV